MKKLLGLIFILCSTAALAQYMEHKTPEQIGQELERAEAQFQRAKKMFIPWYTGPLQTPGANLMPPGWGNINPAVNLTDNYARFDSHRHSHDLPSRLVVFNPTFGMLFGMTSSSDIAMSVQGIANWQYHKSDGGFGDLNLTAGLLVATETLHVPAIKLAIREIFPTGRYHHLNTNGLGLDSTGGGSFQTQLTFALSKVLFWHYLHPARYRAAFSCNIPLPVTVHGFNTYGGGYGTRAKVYPGRTFTAETAIEVSLTQRWVLATDLEYTTQSETNYTGYAGTTAGGESASLGGPSSDSLSLAPAIEYNWNENLGLICGAWFSVYGRNSFHFVTGIISLSWTFQIK